MGQSEAFVAAAELARTHWPLGTPISAPDRSWPASTKVPVPSLYILRRFPDGDISVPANVLLTPLEPMVSVLVLWPTWLTVPDPNSPLTDTFTFSMVSVPPAFTMTLPAPAPDGNSL